MIKITDLNLTLPPEVKTYMLCGLRPFNAYVNGERSNTLAGYVYEICFPELRYEKLSVKVPIEEMTLPLIALDEPIPVGAPVIVSGLTIRSYMSKGLVNLSATAKKIRLDAAPSAKGA